MKKKKRSGKCFAAVILFSIGICFFCGCSEKKTEIVWYISDPKSYGVEEEAKPYQEVEAERFQLFNERLEELKIPAKVVFKYLPDRYEAKQEDFENGTLNQKEFLFQAEKIKKLTEKDTDADIVEFSPLEYGEFLRLDPYLEKEENKKVLKAIPETVWKANTINGKVYQIPNGNISVSEAAYVFYRPFLEKYQITLDEEKIKKMTPEEVVRFFLPYFEKERLLEGNYYLTSASDLDYMNYFGGRYIPVVKNSIDWNLAVDVKEKKIVSLLDTPEMQDMLEINRWIYDENLDAHIERQYRNGMPVFRTSHIPTIQELAQEPESEWKEIGLGNRMVKSSVGNGILKTSDEKELAVRVLAASMYDEELTNLMIYGVPDKEYRLEDGHAVFTEEGHMLSSMGSFQRSGNNRIAYPNELEVKDKAEKMEKLLKETPVQPYGNFTPAFDENLFGKMAEIAGIYIKIEGTSEFEEIPDLEAYIREQKQKLEEAGVTEVVSELQRQLDSWKE